MAKKKIILLTGSSGYLGTELMKELRREDYGVIPFDIKHNPDEDIRIKENLRPLIACCDYVIHLAGIVGDPNCNMDINKAYETNVLGTRNIIELCQLYRKPLVFASSCSVYGTTTKPIVSEKSKINPISLYALTKSISEKEIAEYGLRAVILRFGTLFGYSDTMRFDLVINQMIKNAVEDNKIRVFGGDQRRPFISVSEVCEFILRLLRTKRLLTLSPLKLRRNNIYNLTAFNKTIKDIAWGIAGLIPCEVEIQEQIIDKRDYAVSNHKIKSIYEPIDTFNLEISRVQEYLDNVVKLNERNKK